MRYEISVALNESVVAKNEDEALEIANRRIKQGDYTVMIVDTEPEEFECCKCGHHQEVRANYYCDECGMSNH
jgi:hypothetical protein